MQARSPHGSGVAAAGYAAGHPPRYPHSRGSGCTLSAEAAPDDAGPGVRAGPGEAGVAAVWHAPHHPHGAGAAAARHAAGCRPQSRTVSPRSSAGQSSVTDAKAASDGADSGTWAGRWGAGAAAGLHAPRDLFGAGAAAAGRALASPPESPKMSRGSSCGHSTASSPKMSRGSSCGHSTASDSEAFSTDLDLGRGLLGDSGGRRGLRLGGFLAGSLLLGCVAAAAGVFRFRPPKLLQAYGGPGPQRHFVSELYTFGVPGSSLSALYDASREGGCIPGLRVFSSTERSGMSSRRSVTDPVSWVTAQFNFTHPLMEALEVSDQNVNDNRVHPCSARRSDPPSDDFWWVDGHVAYDSVLKAHMDSMARTSHTHLLRASVANAHGQLLPERLRKAYLMTHFSFMVYSPHLQRLAVDSPDWGWNLVGIATKKATSKGVFFITKKEVDHVTLYQHDTMLNCALIFEGTDRNDQSDFLSDLNIKTEDFCGFGPVHMGFRRKLVQMLQTPDFRQQIRPKLPACAGVALSGHSLGGAQAELFTACANRDLGMGEPGFEDHRLVAFERGATRRLPAYYSEQVHGVFLRNEGSGLCLDVVGRIETESGAEIGLWDCELPAGNYSQDQRWTLTPEGFLVNKLSGKCAHVSGANAQVGGSELRQWTCQTEIGTDSVQRWEYTPEGFLRHIMSKKCLDSKLRMYPCPYSDQLWQMLSDGLIVNRLSGKCLDVSGSPGSEDGASIVLWPCEYGERTDQRWEILPSGVIRNKLSKKCLRWSSDKTMGLFLATCQPEHPGADLSLDFSKSGIGWNGDTGMCLDVDGQPGTEDGSPVRLAVCEDVHIETSGLWTLMPDGFVRNTGNDWENQHLCLEVYGNSYMEKEADGAPIYLDLCKVNTDQKWELTAAGFIKSNIGGRRCVNIDRSGLEISLQLDNCDEWEPAEDLPFRWHLTGDGEIRSQRSLACVTAPEEPGGEVRLEPCRGAGASQRWDVGPGGGVASRLTGGCLGLRGPAEAGGQSALALRPCTASDLPAGNQEWVLMREGLLHDGSGTSCFLEQPGGSPGLAVRACPSMEQRWELTTDGLLRNRAIGRCMNAELDSKGKRRPVMWECDHAVNVYQQWAVINV